MVQAVLEGEVPPKMSDGGGTPFFKYEKSFIELQRFVHNFKCAVDDGRFLGP